MPAPADSNAAALPHVSIEARLVDHPLSASDLIVPPDGCGGDCSFLGRTRAETHPEHGALSALDYDAHRPLAVSVLRELAARVAAEHDCRLARILHATGRVGIGEASVLVQAAAPHRAEAFAACRAMIDELKQLAPVWKRECWADGTTWSTGTAVPPPPADGDSP
ncbi:MAG: molybdenum cofactor biosynthesis protein MoaE [Phycisphaerales bacterium]